jgi:hypothetical protein
MNTIQDKEFLMCNFFDNAVFSRGQYSQENGKEWMVLDLAGQESKTVIALEFIIFTNSTLAILNIYFVRVFSSARKFMLCADKYYCTRGRFLCAFLY